MKSLIKELLLSEKGRNDLVLPERGQARRRRVQAHIQSATRPSLQRLLANRQLLLFG